MNDDYNDDMDLELNDDPLAAEALEKEIKEIDRGYADVYAMADHNGVEEEGDDEDDFIIVEDDAGEDDEPEVVLAATTAKEVHGYIDAMTAPGFNLGKEYIDGFTDPEEEFPADEEKAMNEIPFWQTGGAGADMFRMTEQGLELTDPDGYHGPMAQEFLENFLLPIVNGMARAYSHDLKMQAQGKMPAVDEGQAPEMDDMDILRKVVDNYS